MTIEVKQLNITSRVEEEINRQQNTTTQAPAFSVEQLKVDLMRDIERTVEKLLRESRGR